jgi:protease IV
MDTQGTVRFGVWYLKIYSPPTYVLYPKNDGYVLYYHDMEQMPQEQHSLTTPTKADNTSPRIHSKRALTFALFVGVPALIFWSVAGIGLLATLSLFADEEEYCNVARIPVHGILSTIGEGGGVFSSGTFTRADDFVAQVELADEDPYIDAIVLDIDSPGGTPVSADEMLDALLRAQKPVVAVVRELGASAGYWVASGADHIIASPVSQVGSIGVTMSYLETASSTDLDGARWVDISSGLFKDAGHPERVLREEERSFFQEQVASVYEYMIERIREARGVLTHEDLSALADGRVYTGTEALGLRLVDALGGFREALTWLEVRVGMEEGGAVLCPLPSEDLFDML